MRRSQKAACAAALFLTSSAGAIELSFAPNWDDYGDEVEMQLSETAVISVHLGMFAGEGNLSFIDIFFDATPINDPASVGYDVVGREFKMVRDDGSGWFRAEEWDGQPGMEDYRLIAADDEDGGGPGTNGPGLYVVDSIIVHGTEIGSYDLYFENFYTAEGDPRPPRLRDLNGREWDDDIWHKGLIWYRNAWRDDAENFDVPFKVIVVPEPSTVGLFLVGAGVAVRRSKRNLS